MPFMGLFLHQPGGIFQTNKSIASIYAQFIFCLNFRGGKVGKKQAVSLGPVFSI
jgi:hypothetical protein